jgi:adenylate kinase family enzyme
VEKQEIYEKTLQIHLKQLKNLDVKNSKIIVSFSGVPCSGKSTLANDLEKHFKAVKINTDDIRDIIKQVVPVDEYTRDELQELLIEYNVNFFEYLRKIPNGFLIIDASVDRNYELVKKTAEDGGYILYIIRILIEKDELIESFKKRNMEKDKEIIGDIDIYYDDFKKACEKFEPDYLIKDRKKADMREIIKSIEEVYERKY